MSSKKILITGATGFIGAYILHYLIQHGETSLRGLKRPDSPMDLVSGIAGQVEWVEADLLDLPSLEHAMEDVTHVYHCAAIVSFSRGDARHMIRVNQEGTANIVNIALDMNLIVHYRETLKHACLTQHLILSITMESQD